ncbi:MAG: Fic family protein, partial [Candidatus Rhabdochlamydia sp.]
QFAAADHLVTEKIIQTLHALVMADGRTKVKPTPYRDSQNVIRDGRTKAIVYMPPEAKDVTSLMKGMIHWIQKSQDVPCPIVAAISHYQFATIHPYYDGNGRTARLLTTLILHLGGYDLKGLYSLEEYYARNLGAYYEAISIGESHNYYMGRAEADITKWVEYFIKGMAISFENVLKRMADAEGSPDQSNLIRKLDPRQRRALELFQEFETVTSRQIAELFGFKPRTSAQVCAAWVENGFLEVVDSSNRGRKYKLSKQYENLN